MIGLVFLIIESVLKEVEKIGHDCFGTFRFQEIYQIIIGGRGELDQYLTYDPDLWFADIFVDQKSIKIIYDLPAESVKSRYGYMIRLNEPSAGFYPFPVKFIGRTRCQLVRPHAIEASHENVTDRCCAYTSQQELGRDLEARI